MERRNYFIIYTGIFMILTPFVFFQFLIHDKSFIWAQYDGIAQHFVALEYYGEYLRGILHSFFQTGRFEVPMWDFSIGMGEDIITALSYYVIGDPFAFLSILMPGYGGTDSQSSWLNPEIFYNFLILLRLYVAGITFSLYCFYMKQKEFNTLLGALSYVFCFYALYAGVRHPYFLLPMIYFPLLLIGLEKIFSGEKTFFFIASVFLSAISNFYFFYMLSILLFLYGVIRYWDFFPYRQKTDFFRLFGTCTGYYLLGVGMAAVTVLPVVMFLFSGERLSGGHTSQLFLYDKGYYLWFLLSQITPVEMASWTRLGYVPLALISIITLFTIKRKFRTAKISFLILVCFLLIPFWGYAFNGFGYVANRFCWIYSFLVSFLIVLMGDFLFQHRPVFFKKMNLIAFCIYSTIAIAAIFYYQFKKQVLYYLIGAIFCYLFTLLGIYFFPKLKTGRKTLIALLMVVIPVIINAQLTYMPQTENYIAEFLPSKTAFSALNQKKYEVLPGFAENDFYRVDMDDSFVWKADNASMVWNTYGISAFLSLLNGNVINNYKEQAILDLTNYSRYAGLDNRTALNTLAGVRYTVKESGSPFFLPYGFEKIASQTISDKKYTLYENRNFLPLGYTYTNQISPLEYSQLSPLEKQQALLDRIVLEPRSTSTAKETPLQADPLSEAPPQASPQTSPETDLSSQKLPFVVKTDENITLTENKKTGELLLNVKKKNASLKLNWEEVSNTEQYVQFKLSALKFNDSAATAGNVYVKTSLGKKRIIFRTPENQHYMPDMQFLVNLGYTKDNLKHCTITFQKTGQYRLRQFGIYRVSMENFDQKISQLKENVLENIEIKTNQITGLLNLDQSKILCLAIPFSKGWSAKVDGKSADLQKANGMYIAIKMEKGQHQIVLQYETPWLRTACYLSIFSWLVLGGMILWRKFH